jgi:hypothetical protein
MFRDKMTPAMAKRKPPAIDRHLCRRWEAEDAGDFQWSSGTEGFFRFSWEQSGMWLISDGTIQSSFKFDLI